MAARICLFWLMIALMCGWMLAAEPSNTIRWAPDMATAREASAKYKVPLLVHFYGDGCLPCRTLEDRVLSKPEVVNTLNKFFISIAINATKQPQIAAEFGVHSWPTDVFVGPDGQTLHRGVCPQDIQAYLSVLQNVAVMNRDRNVLLAQPTKAAPSQSSPAPLGQPVTQQSVTASAPPATGSPTDSVASNQGSVASALGVGDLSPFSPHTQLPKQSPNHLGNNAFSTAAQEITAGAALPPHPAISGPLTTQVQAGRLTSSQQPSVISGPMPTEQTQIASQTIANSPLSAIPFPPLSTLSSENSSLPPRNSLVAYSPSTPQVEQQEQPSDSATSQSIASPAITQDNPHFPSLQDQPGEASLDGYCPVALRKQQWLPGSAQYAVQHRGKTYWLSSEAAASEFLRTPDDYTPVLSGADPLVLLNEGKLVAGSIQHGLFEAHSGQVLLFQSAQSKAHFQQNFDKNMQALNAVRERAAAR